MLYFLLGGLAETKTESQLPVLKLPNLGSLHKALLKDKISVELYCNFHLSIYQLKLRSLVEKDSDKSKESILIFVR